MIDISREIEPMDKKLAELDAELKIIDEKLAIQNDLIDEIKRHAKDDMETVENDFLKSINRN